MDNDTLVSDQLTFLERSNVNSGICTANINESVLTEVSSKCAIKTSGTSDSQSNAEDVTLDEGFWEEINQNLQCHGLQKLDPSSLMCLNTKSAFSIKIIISQLLKDNNRRQAIIQDLLSSNTQLKDLLQQQKEATTHSHKTLNSMESSLSKQKNKIKELEEIHVMEMRKMNEKILMLRDENNNIKSKYAKVEQINKNLSQDLDKLNRKNKKREEDSGRVFYEIKSQCSRGERISDRKILSMIDHYEEVIDCLKCKITSLAQQEQNQMTSDRSESIAASEESEADITHQSIATKIRNADISDENARDTIRRYKELCSNLEKSVVNLKRKYRESENEKTLMKIEMDTRFTTNELLYAQKRVQVLENLLRKNNIKIPATVQSPPKELLKRKEKEMNVSVDESTAVSEINYLNIETARKYLKMFCSHLHVEDLQDVLPRLREFGEKAHNFQKMKRFIHEVTEILSDDKLPCNLTPGNKRDGVSRRSYKTCIQTLDLWAKELKLVSELYHSINTLISTLIPAQKILPLLNDLSVSDLKNFVDSISQENIREIGSDQLQVDVKTVRDMVRHFQQLFDCPSIQGVYPRMNEVFSKLEESRNTINTFKDLLGLDLTTTSTRTLIGAFEAVCREFNNRAYDQLKSLVSDDDLKGISEKVRIHDEFFPEFEEMAEELMKVLGVESLDRVVPAVRTLKLVSRH